MNPRYYEIVRMFTPVDPMTSGSHKNVTSAGIAFQVIAQTNSYKNLEKSLLTTIVSDGDGILGAAEMMLGYKFELVTVGCRLGNALCRGSSHFLLRSVFLASRPASGKSCLLAVCELTCCPFVVEVFCDCFFCFISAKITRVVQYSGVMKKSRGHDHQGGIENL